MHILLFFLPRIPSRHPKHSLLAPLPVRSGRSNEMSILHNRSGTHRPQAATWRIVRGFPLVHALYSTFNVLSDSCHLKHSDPVGHMTTRLTSWPQNFIRHVPSYCVCATTYQNIREAAALF